MKKVTFVANAEGDEHVALALDGDGPKSDLFVAKGKQVEFEADVPRRAKGAEGEDAGRTWH